MIQESVADDLANTLIACRWMAGTTTRAVKNPANNLVEVVTTAPSAVYPLTAGSPVRIIDEFPDGSSTPVENTMAVSMPLPGDGEGIEMGSNFTEQPYLVSIGFYASTDALASAVLSDLKDRYEGRLVWGEAIPLINYLDDPDVIVSWMDVETFRYAADSETVAPDGPRLYFAEVGIVDFA
jgi:hypothetical protein